MVSETMSDMLSRLDARIRSGSIFPPFSRMAILSPTGAAQVSGSSMNPRRFTWESYGFAHGLRRGNVSECRGTEQSNEERNNYGNEADRLAGSIGRRAG